MKRLEQFAEEVQKDDSLQTHEICNYPEKYKSIEEDFKAQFYELKKEDLIADIRLKKMYGKCVLGVLAGWCLLVAFICITYMFQNYPNLSDNVLITLFTTTTANIIALPTIVLKYLFSKK